MRRWLIASLVCCVLAGCSSGDNADRDDDTSRSSDLPLSATLTQTRGKEGTRAVNAQLTNISDAPVTVATVTLDSSRFAALPPVEKDTAYVPGRTIDLAIEYGEPTCDGPLEQSSFTVQLADESTVELSIDREGMVRLNNLYAKECALKAIDQIATIQYGDTFEPATINGELVLTGEVVLRRPAGSDKSATLTVNSMDGSVLIRMEPVPPGSLPKPLRPGVEELRIPFLFGALRCDEHARGESSQTFVLSVFVKPPGLPEQRVVLIPSQPLKNQISNMLTDACANPGS